MAEAAVLPLHPAREVDLTRAEDAVRNLLSALGYEAVGEHRSNTPRRVAAASAFRQSSVPPWFHPLVFTSNGALESGQVDLDRKWNGDH